MYIDKTIFSKYSSYFHDGSLVAIEYGENNADITLTLESAEIDPEDLQDLIPLSDNDRIKGKLHLKEVKSIYVNNKKLKTQLKMNYDDGGIFDLEIKDNEIILDISWYNYPPKASTDDFSSIKIKVEDVHWENIPK